MKKRFTWLVTLWGIATSVFAQKPIEVLYITGHTDRYHSWETMSGYQLGLLEESGLFRVDTLILPAIVTEEPANFSAYDVVILNINDVQWPTTWKNDFEEYMRRGGGLVIMHEADNAFPEWEAFNEMIGLGGWGNRNEEAGPYHYWTEDGWVTDRKTPGRAGHHGERVPFVINLRQPDHPIVKGMPMQWLHVNDELYGNLRGPARHMEVIATAFSDGQSGGTGKEEPVLFTIRYRKGRIFHCVLGHTMPEYYDALKNRGYQLLFQRGTEWAATGRVTQKIPVGLELSPSTPTLREIKLKKQN
jgi:type 1 glutamine amidotransferase